MNTSAFGGVSVAASTVASDAPHPMARPGDSDENGDIASDDHAQRYHRLLAQAERVGHGPLRRRARASVHEIVQLGALCFGNR
jgi:hypothetical protein